jgi:hypothetical protein
MPGVGHSGHGAGLPVETLRMELTINFASLPYPIHVLKRCVGLCGRHQSILFTSLFFFFEKSFKKTFLRSIHEHVHLYSNKISHKSSRKRFYTKRVTINTDVAPKQPIPKQRGA